LLREPWGLKRFQAKWKPHVTIAGADHFPDHIEIDLLFAQAELSAAPTDRSALIRAVRHIDQALKSVRAHKRKPGKTRLAKTVAA
jgi:hypothetical protein